MNKENKTKFVTDSNIYAKIISLDKFAELTIKFNQVMNTNINFTQLNSINSNLELAKRKLNASDNTSFSNVMCIYVIHYTEWEEYRERFEMQQLNLTWRAIEYKDNILKIKIDFNNQSYISPLVVQDTLVVWINENKTFF